MRLLLEVGVLRVQWSNECRLETQIYDVCVCVDCCCRSGFPGAQPVSMDRQNLRFLEQNPYKVSWKADGTRWVYCSWVFFTINDSTSTYVNTGIALCVSDRLNWLLFPFIRLLFFFPQSQFVYSEFVSIRVLCISCSSLLVKTEGNTDMTTVSH